MADKEFDTISATLKSMGFKTIEKQTSPKEFNWNPDFYAQIDGSGIAILVRRIEDNIPDIFIQKIASTKSRLNKLEIFVVFLNEPKRKTIEKIALYGIGVMALRNRKMPILSPSRNFSAKMRKISELKRLKKPPKMSVYPSSHQSDKERKIITDIVNQVNKSFQVPVFTYLLEDHREREIRGLNQDMVDNINDADIFIGIIRKEDSKNVLFEFKQAFLLLDGHKMKTHQLIIFVQDMPEKIRAKKLVKLIESIKKRKDLKYLSYYSLQDFKTKATTEIYHEIARLYKLKGLVSPFSK